MSDITRKSIFMQGLKNKISYVFTYKVIKEMETIIDFYEKQLQQRDSVIEEAIKYIKNKKAIINTDYIKLFDLFGINEQGYIDKLLEILNKYKENK